MKTKMKTIPCIFLIIGFIVSANSFAQTGKGYVLEGDISGLINPTKLYLCIHPGIDTVAQTIAYNGKFSFKGKVKNAANMYFIKMDTLVTKRPSNAIWLMNKTVKMRSSLSKWPEVEISGSEAQNDYNNLLQLYNRIKNKGNDSIATAYKNFINRHRNSLYIAHLISKMKPLLGLSFVKASFANLTHRAKNTHFGLQLRKEIEQLQLAEHLKAGAVLPNFKVTNSDGQQLSMLEYVKKGKLTLIDFWASWCKPCREETPNLKKVYNAFHSKGFNIIGVSTDKNETDWKRALREENTSWFHGRDNLEQAYKEIFAIGAIPAFALVDGDGKMIAFSCPSSTIPSFGPEIRGEALYKTIEKLLIKSE